MVRGGGEGERPTLSSRGNLRKPLKYNDGMA